MLKPRLGALPGPQPDRRYSVAPSVLRSAQTGRGYVDVCRPNTDAWVRLGLREGALLLGLSGAPFDELQIRFGNRFTSSELSAALEETGYPDLAD